MAMEGPHPAYRGQGPSLFTLEWLVAVVCMALGTVVMWDSLRVGAGWAADGPQAGYFPFYVGLLIWLSSAVTLVQAVYKRVGRRDRLFASWEQLWRVCQVLIPSMVYVLAIPWLGIYLPTALFIGWFMWRIGNYGAIRILPTAVGIPLVTFLTFEVWFKLPLPKGPVEHLLGF